MTDLPALADATWTEVAAAERGLLVLPLGSVEQHGPHLPLATDTILASAVAGAVVAARPGAGLAPAQSLGASGEHADFPGTLSIGTSALATLLVELCRHASRDWRGVLVVNGHGGNRDALLEAAATCRAEGRLLAVVPAGVPGGDAHAGRTETSLLLHLAPALVRTDLLAPGATEPLTELLPRLTTAGVASVAPSGVLGDPTYATAAEGADLLADIVARALAAYDAALD